MTQAIVGNNVKVEVEASLVSDSPPLVPSSISQDNPGVVNLTAHGFSNGAVVKLTVAGGMVELDGQAARVANVTTNSFELEGVDTTTFDPYTTGFVHAVGSWQTFASAQDVTMPNPTPTKLDTTTLIDRRKQYVYALPDAPDGSITGLFNPAGAAEALIRAATKTNTPLAFRINFSSGQKSIFNAHVSGGSGFNLPANAIATTTTAFTPVNDVIHYAT